MDDKDLEKEVKLDIKKLLSNPDMLNKDFAFAKEQFHDSEAQERENAQKKKFSEALVKIENEKQKIKKMSDEEIANWLIDQHEQYTETINWSVSQDFLNGTSMEERYMILLYMYNLWIFLNVREIEVFSNNVATIIAKKGHAELLAILNVMNYI